MNKTLKQAIKIRAKYCCEYCLTPEYFSPDPFENDHIQPSSKDGDNDFENYAFSCSGCNGFKFNAIEAIDPASAQVVRLYNPRKDIWNEHFCWDENFTVLLGISPIGRATVFKLKLNRTGLINLRVALRTVGEFPI